MHDVDDERPEVPTHPGQQQLWLNLWDSIAWEKYPILRYAAEWPIEVDDGDYSWSETRVGAAQETDSGELLEFLAGDPAWQTRFYVASNPHATAEVLTKLARDGLVKVRWAVMGNPGVPSEVLTEMISSSTPLKGACMAASNPALDPELMLAMAGEFYGDRKDDDQLHQALARNPALIGSAAWELEKSPMWLVRMLLADNAATPAYVLEKLSWDTGPDVVRCHVAARPEVSDATLRRLASDRNPTVRQYVPWNPEVDLDLVAGLLDDESAKVRVSVMEHAGQRLAETGEFKSFEGHDPFWGTRDPQLASKRIEKALCRYAGGSDFGPANWKRTGLLLDADTYARLVDPPKGVAKVVADLLELLAPLPGYAPISECVDAAEALVAMPKYRQAAAWVVLTEQPSEPLRAVRSVARAASQAT
ncbi:MAG: hypothetical protein GY882_03890 [Actinomycetia bacterium]|nr:hypothetical protein [Actinomycetes bacterium]MCP4843671.1 hypothetical protein [Actinomycetes bacterium]